MLAVPFDASGADSKADTDRPESPRELALGCPHAPSSSYNIFSWSCRNKKVHKGYASSGISRASVTREPRPRTVSWGNSLIKCIRCQNELVWSSHISGTSSRWRARWRAVAWSTKFLYLY